MLENVWALGGYLFLGVIGIVGLVLTYQDTQTEEAMSDSEEQKV